MVSSSRREAGPFVPPSRLGRSASDIDPKFMTALPAPSVFLCAWVILVELMVHGLGSPEEAPEAYSALMWYGKWIVDKSVGFTWESICRYHLRVCSGRFAGTFHVDQWYKAIDTDAAIALVRKYDNSRSDTAHSSSPSKAKAKTTTRRPAAGSKRDVSSEVYYTYNLTGCKDLASMVVATCAWTVGRRIESAIANRETRQEPSNFYGGSFH